MNQMPKVQIYHNPACGTSRNTLALIRNAGIEPERSAGQHDSGCRFDGS